MIFVWKCHHHLLFMQLIFLLHCVYYDEVASVESEEQKEESDLGKQNK